MHLELDFAEKIARSLPATQLANAVLWTVIVVAVQSVVLATEWGPLSTSASGGAASAWSAFASFEFATWSVLLAYHWALYAAFMIAKRADQLVPLASWSEWAYLGLSCLHAFVTPFTPDRVLALVAPDLAAELAPSTAASFTAAWGSNHSTSAAELAQTSPWAAQMAAWAASEASRADLSSSSAAMSGWPEPPARVAYPRCRGLAFAVPAGASSSVVGEGCYFRDYETVVVLLTCLYAITLALRNLVRPLVFLLYVHIAVGWYLCCRGVWGSLDSLELGCVRLGLPTALHAAPALSCAQLTSPASPTSPSQVRLGRPAPLRHPPRGRRLLRRRRGRAP